MSNQDYVARQYVAWNAITKNRIVNVGIGLLSSVERGGIGLPTKMQNKKNTTFLALLRFSFVHWIGLKNDLKHSLKRLFGRGGANELPTKMQNKKNTIFGGANGLPTKMQDMENTTFLAFLRLSFALDLTKK